MKPAVPKLQRCAIYTCKSPRAVTRRRFASDPMAPVRPSAINTTSPASTPGLGDSTKAPSMAVDLTPKNRTSLHTSIASVIDRDDASGSKHGCESVKNTATQLKDVAIDVLINCAGIAGVPGQKTGNVDYESWAQVLNVNTMGPGKRYLWKTILKLRQEQVPGG